MSATMQNRSIKTAPDVSVAAEPPPATIANPTTNPVSKASAPGSRAYLFQPRRYAAIVNRISSMIIPFTSSFADVISVEFIYSQEAFFSRATPELFVRIPGS
jgi:hypothetical protein